eukprot:4527773-Prymnesium_polylepis.1
MRRPLEAGAGFVHAHEARKCTTASCSRFARALHPAAFCGRGKVPSSRSPHRTAHTATPARYTSHLRSSLAGLSPRELRPSPSPCGSVDTSVRATLSDPSV